MLEIKTTAAEVKNASDGGVRDWTQLRKEFLSLIGISKEICKTEKQAGKKTDGKQKRISKDCKMTEGVKCV